MKTGTSTPTRTMRLRPQACGRSAIASGASAGRTRPHWKGAASPTEFRGLGKRRRFAVRAVVLLPPFPKWRTVGLSLRAARELGIEARAGRFPFRANGRAATSGDEGGFVKIVVEIGSDKILGRADHRAARDRTDQRNRAGDAPASGRAYTGGFAARAPDLRRSFARRGNARRWKVEVCSGRATVIF